MRITEVSAATRSRVRTLLAAAAACSLSACANYSQVISEDADGSYKLIATGISYTMSMPALTAASHQKAASWAPPRTANCNCASRRVAGSRWKWK